MVLTSLYTNYLTTRSVATVEVAFSFLLGTITIIAYTTHMGGEPKVQNHGMTMCAT